MADIYIALSSFANPPTKKLARELAAAWPQITGYTRHEGPFESPPGTPRAPGYVIHTSNPDPDPDEASIVAQALANDGSEDPPIVGTRIPLYLNAAALPTQPPDIEDVNTAYMVGVRNPAPALYFWVAGAWRGPLLV